MALISCDRLSLSYDNFEVINDLSFSVEKGEHLCIVGENGSGKSTLVKALLGLHEISGGRISYCEGLTGREIGYLPQKSELQRDFPASVKEVVLSGALGKGSFRPFYSSSDKKLAEGNLKRLGISELSRRSFSELSGGQQQRVLLARALCATKKLLLLDEPEASLDSAATRELYSVISELCAQGIAVITVSHDLVSAVSTASRVLVLDKHGHCLKTPDEFLSELTESGKEETEQ